jgi:hypothetical protein
LATRIPPKAGYRLDHPYSRNHPTYWKTTFWVTKPLMDSLEDENSGSLTLVIIHRILSAMAKDYLTVQASSVPFEFD